MKHPVIWSLCILTNLTSAGAQPAPKPAPRPTETAPQAADAILLTVVLRHDQSMTVDEIQKLQDKQGFYKSFPPAGTAVVSWNVVMGIGQVVTLEVPAAKLRDVNLAIEKTAWRAFKTEFYATYDLYPFVREKLANQHKVNR